MKKIGINHESNILVFNNTSRIPNPFDFPPLDPGTGSPDSFGSEDVNPLKVDNPSVGKFSAFDILADFVTQSCFSESSGCQVSRSGFDC